MSNEDVIHTIKDSNNTIWAHFKQEMFLSIAIDRNRINTIYYWVSATL